MFRIAERVGESGAFRYRNTNRTYGPMRYVMAEGGDIGDASAGAERPGYFPRLRLTFQDATQDRGSCGSAQFGAG
jgi:hypothetical protein